MNTWLVILRLIITEGSHEAIIAGLEGSVLGGQGVKQPYVKANIPPTCKSLFNTHLHHQCHFIYGLA